MTQVLTIEDVRPSPRYDSLPWTEARLEESTTATGPWALVETFTLAPVDADPSNPAYRNFTTQLASDGELWYRIIFADADGDIGQPTYPIQNTLNARPVYASVSELARLVRVSATDRHASLLRVLESAATEIDAEIGSPDINGNTLPYTAPPSLVTEVNIERAVEHWQQMQSPFGILGMGDAGALYTARDSWDRHALKLAPLKGSWGIS